MADVEVVVLAGGLGTRLGALAEGLPKPMIPVAGRPFLEHVVRQLAGQGLGRLVLLVGYGAQVIRDHFGEGRAFGVDIEYSEEPAPLGTGGAIRLAAPLLGPRFLMLYGDLYRPFDYAGFVRRRSGSCLAVYPYVSGLTTISAANVGIADGSVTAYVKGDPSARLTHVDAGFGVFRREVVDLLPEGSSSFEEIVYPSLAARCELEAELVDRTFFDIGNPSDLAHAREHLQQHL